MNKLSKIFGVVVMLAMLVGVFPMASAAPAAAAPGNLQWDYVSTPDDAAFLGGFVGANTDWYSMAVDPSGNRIWLTGESGAGVGRARYSVTGGSAWRTPTLDAGMSGGRSIGKVVIAPDDGNVIAMVTTSAVAAGGASGSTVQLAVATAETVAAISAIGATTITLSGAPADIFVGSQVTVPSEVTIFTVTGITGVVLTVTPALTAATVVGNAVSFAGFGTAATQVVITPALALGSYVIGTEAIQVTGVAALVHTITRAQLGTTAAVAAAAAVVSLPTAAFRNNVWVSTDAGITWANSGFAVTTAATEYISDLKWSPSYSVGGGTGRDLGVVTYDTAGGTFGKVWMYQMKTTGFAGGWINVSPTAAEDFLAINFPAGYGGDFSFLVLSQSGANVVLNMGLRVPNAVTAPFVNWNAAAFVGYPATVAVAVAVTGDIATPADFAGQVGRQQRTWVCFEDNVGAASLGDVYRIDGGRPAVRLNAGGRPTSLSYSGSFTTGKLLVGMVEGVSATFTVNALRSLNAQTNQPTWDPPFKAATGAGAGQSRTQVMWAPNGKSAFLISGTTKVAINAPATMFELFKAAWLSTANDETGLSVTTDDGDSWNGRAYLDTTTNRYTDVAVSDDGTVMFVSSVQTAVGGFDSLWRNIASGPSLFGGDWMRVGLVNTGTRNKIAMKLSPEKADGSVLFWADLGGNIIQRSIDRGNTWNACGAVSTAVVNDFVATDQNTIFTAGANGKVAKGVATGFSWTWGAEMPTLATALYSITAQGQNIIVAGAYPIVSLDGGVTWIRNLGTAPAGTVGNAVVAMDADFANNKYYYVSWTGSAAGSLLGTAGPVVCRVKAPGSVYEDIYTGTPYASTVDVVYAGIAASSQSGNFYAMRNPSPNAAGVSLAAGTVGAIRTIEGLNTVPKPGLFTDRLNIGMPVNSSFSWDPAGTAVEFTAPNQLHVTGKAPNIYLWAVDLRGVPGRTVNGQIRAFTDTLTAAKSVVSATGAVANKATVDVAFNGFNLPYPIKYSVVSASRTYQWQLAMTNDFADVVAGAAAVLPTNTTDPTVVIPTLTMMAGQNYFFRVRVDSAETTQAITTPWSDILALTVKAGVPVTQTSTGVQASAPSLGAQGVNTTGVGFAWSGLQGATEYKFVLASDATMTKTLVSTSVKGTAYMYDGKLTESTSYFWQVTPVGGDASAVFSFTTKAAAVTTAPVAPAPIVIPAPVVNIPAASTATPVWVWAVIGVGAVLVIVTLVLIFRTRRV